MMVDGGPARDWSNSGKIAADFLYWKMFVDQSWKNEFNFRREPFHIEQSFVRIRITITLAASWN
jgi:hypothetical protein